MHHSRRKSGHGSANTSMTDVRKAVTASENTPSRHKSSRPSTMTRRHAPVVGKLGRNPRDRERDWEEERWWEDERESFPQYCMTCEKQFVPQDDRFLYCSEACRAHDQDNGNGPASSAGPRSHTASASHYPFYAAGHPEPKDIIPRASPSRPSSMHFSPPTTPSAVSHVSAISALRSLSLRDPSPPSPTVMGTYHTSIWPFTRTTATSPSTSYNRPTSGLYPSTYDGYYSTASYGMTSPGMDRPLPPSRRPGNYPRPKSIELVTPMVGR